MVFTRHWPACDPCPNGCKMAGTKIYGRTFVPGISISILCFILVTHAHYPPVIKHSNGKSQKKKAYMGETSINWTLCIAMFDEPRGYLHFSIPIFSGHVLGLQSPYFRDIFPKIFNPVSTVSSCSQGRNGSGRMAIMESGFTVSSLATWHFGLVVWYLIFLRILFLSPST